MNNSDLTIAIVSYNSYDTITKCLDVLITSSHHEIIIVDNASTDGSTEKIEKQYPQAHLIKSNINLGYGRAANLAIQSCSTKYLFLINPDLKATNDKTTHLLHTIKKQSDDVALLAPSVAPKTYTQQGLIQKEWVIGAAMMFNLETLSKVGYFDENIFLFSEESDLCKRICDGGFKILLDSDLYIEHLYRQSCTPNPATEALKDWHQAWSRAYFYKKHGLDHGKKNPYRVALIYIIKYFTSLNKEKRRRYYNRMNGTIAFILKHKAIKHNGEPVSPNMNTHHITS